MGCPLPAGRGGFCEGSAVSGTRGVLQDPLERGWAGGSELCWEEQRAGVRRPARGSSRALTSVWLRVRPSPCPYIYVRGLPVPTAWG